MLGHSHALSGGLLWLAAVPVVNSAMPHALSPAEVAAGTVACAGAALLPDIDHPGSKIAHALGPVTQLVATAVNVLAGGHRKATHSLVFIVVSGVGTWAGVRFGGVSVAAGIFFAAVSLGLRGLNLVPPNASSITGGVTIGAQTAAITWLAVRFLPAGWPWLVPAMLIGVTAHLLGDTLTPEGVPWLWPSRARFAVPVIGRTGDLVEGVLATVMGVGLALLSWQAFAGPVGGVLALR